MDSNPSGNGPPPKPWERAGSSSGPAPFKPPSAGSTSDVVEASGTAKPGEIVSSSDRSAAVNRTAVARPVPSRPWEQNYGTSNTYGGYGSTVNYNSGYGSGVSGMSGMYGGTAGGLYGGTGGGLYGGTGGGLYGGGMYGSSSSMYRGGYGGGGLYGSSGGMYGGGMYNSGLGAPMGGYGMGMGGPYGGQDPNDPYGPPPSQPGFWLSVLRVTQGVVNFFGRIAILMDQNTQAFHLFMSALLQLFDRSGLLYGELARFVLRILGIKTKANKVHPQGPNGVPLQGPHGPHGPHGGPMNQNYIEGPRPAPGGAWDNVWENDTSK